MKILAIPGNNPPSAIPRIARRLINWANVCMKPIHMHIMPHIKAIIPIQTLGVTRFKTRLLGIVLLVVMFRDRFWSMGENLRYDIEGIKRRQSLVVFCIRHPKIRLQVEQLCVANIGAIEERA
jgi:hypothetical protein